MNFLSRLRQSLQGVFSDIGKSWRVRGGALSLASFLLAVYVSALPGDHGFKNGFENGSWGGWDVISEADAVVIVGAEGPAQFSIYGELDVEVEPNRGESMLRMGTPKTKNETQPRGLNAISQQFVANTGAISVALRLFSLDHRGDDFLRISLVGAGGDIFSEDEFKLRDGLLCAAEEPCDVAIDVGKRKDVIKTEWQVLRFPGLEPGQSYTLTIELEAGQNESLASWLYVDSVNEAPTAVINFNPGSGEAVEGDFVVFDCLDSVDPEGSELTCTWTASGPGFSPPSVIGPTVVYSFPEGLTTYDVSVVVSDGEESATTSTPITIDDQPALVNALDVEVLAGGTVDLVCRYVDPGVLDPHDLSFTVTGGGSIIGDIVQVKENDPALSSGYARVTYQAPGQAGTITGSMCTAGGSSADFTITVLDPDVLDPDKIAYSPRNSEANNGSTVGAPEVNSDQSILGRLEEPDSVAVYQLLPDADSGLTSFPPGTEVVVTAQMPVDYDIVLLSGSAVQDAKPWASAPFVSAPFVSAPFVSVPFVSAPFVSAPFVSAPFVSAPFVSAPFVSAPFVSAPFVSAPFVSAPFVSVDGVVTRSPTTSPWITPGFSFENFLLSQLAGAPDGSNISGADVTFGDLGAVNAGPLANEPVFLKGLSAEFGTNTEQLLVEIGPGEDGLYLAVIPQNGSFSTAPFSLEVEASVPLPTKELLGDACTGSPLNTEHENMQPKTYGDHRGETLIVTQKQRMMAAFELEEPEWTAMMTAMTPFFDMVNAKVVSVPRSIYDVADTNPCNVKMQNELAEAIKDFIKEQKTDNTKYVQLMGSLDIIPPYYVPDETQTGNEWLFASDLLTRPGTPLGAAISEGYMLTDAFYVDSDPQPFNGRQLYLEDISVSRLVETPQEIIAKAERFANTGGKINIYSVSVETPNAGTQSTGYDFFVDGTEAINNTLQGLGYPFKTLNQKLNDSTMAWDADDLRCQFFGKGCEGPVNALNVVNAHMSYNAGLSEKGFNCQYLGDTCPNTSELGEVFLSSEYADIYENPVGDENSTTLINGVTFSIGCHSGLSVPDAWGLPKGLGLPLDPASDWVQELGTWVGSYNFAYGDTDVADRGTEGIMPLVIENFTQGMTLGDALVHAKWRYGAGLFEFGVYDEKSLVGLNLFGMPQATLENPVVPDPPAPQLTGSRLNLETNVEMQPDNGKGVWFAVGGQAQAILGRPLLPVIKPFELQPVLGTTTHGVALRGGSYTTYLNEDPVFPAQTHDLVTSISEPQPCVETLSPSLIASVNRFDSPQEPLETLVVQPGQFKCTNEEAKWDDQGEPNPNYKVSGDFRIWNTLNLELLHPIEGASDDDLQPPVVTRQDLLGDPETGDVTAILDAYDIDENGDEVVDFNRGIREIIALVYEDADDGTGTATEYTVDGDLRNEEGVYELSLLNAFDKLLSFQYIDYAGNITAKTLKGALLRAIEVSIRTSFINLAGNTQIVVEISDFDELVGLAPYMTIDFGDVSKPLLLELDKPGPYTLTTTDTTNPDGTTSTTATVVIDHVYSGLSDTGSVIVRVEVRAAGALGIDEKEIFACGDDVDDVVGLPNANIIGCGITSSGTDLAIDVIVDGVIADDLQYRLILPQSNTQIKYSGGKVSGPKKTKPMVIPMGEDRLQFLFNAARIGWDGVSLFEFQFETQDGVSGGQGQGFIDTTDVKTYLP